MKRYITTILVLMLLAPSAVVFGQLPVVEHTVPAAVRPGESLEITLVGANLGAPTALWASFSSSAELASGKSPAPESATYRVHVPAEVPLGIGGLRVATDKGVSSLRLFAVDHLPSLIDDGSHRSRASALAVAPPMAVDGACAGETSNYYHFTGKAGQQIAAEVVARRLGSPLDPLLRLLDAAGKELASSDDEPATGVDSYLTCTLPADGEYLLELRDVRYQGGPKHRFRLRLGDIKPLANHQPQSSSDMQQLAEVEPNDSPDQTTPISLPARIEGRLATAGDRDLYRFDAQSGQRFLITGQTRVLGSPADLFLRVFKADGSVLAEADDMGTNEGALDLKIPADGSYFLSAEDLGQRGGESYVYRLRAEPYHPGFSLAVETDKFDAPQGGVFVAKVTCARREYNGPITLTLDGAPEGIELQNHVIGEGTNETVLRATLPPQLPAGSMASFRIIGRAKIGDIDVQARASSVVPLRAAFSGLPYPPPELDGNLGLGVGPVFPEFFQLTAEPATISLSLASKAANFKVRVTRSQGFEDKVSIALEGLPPGLTAKAPAIEAKQPEATVELTGEETLAPGKYNCRLIGNATHQNQPQQRVIEPLVIEVTP